VETNTNIRWERSEALAAVLAVEVKLVVVCVALPKLVVEVFRFVSFVKVLIVVLEEVVVVLRALAILLIEEFVILVGLAICRTVLFELVEVVLVVEIAGCGRLRIHVSAGIEHSSEGHVCAAETSLVWGSFRHFSLAGVNIQCTNLSPNVIQSLFQIVFLAENWEARRFKR